MANKGGEIRKTKYMFEKNAEIFLFLGSCKVDFTFYYYYFLFSFFLKQQFLFLFLLLFGTSLNKIIIYIFLKYKYVMELVRYWVILQIGVGQDDKFDKENIFFKAQKG